MTKREFYDDFYKKKDELGLIRRESCSPEENQMFLEMVKNNEELPLDVFQYSETDGFYRYVSLEIDKEDLQEYYTLKQLETLNIIKNCMSFFVILTVLSMIVALFLGLSTCA